MQKKNLHLNYKIIITDDDIILDVRMLTHMIQEKLKLNIFKAGTQNSK